MSGAYRDVHKPANTSGWTTADWNQWLTSQRLPAPIVGTEGSLCQLCFGPVGLRGDGTPWPRCFPCRDHVGGNIEGLIPIAFSHRLGLEAALHRYKDFAGYRWLRAPLGSMLWAFLDRHLDCVERDYGAIDVMTVVPDAPDAGRNFDHMKTMILEIKDWVQTDPWDLDLLTRRPGELISRHPNWQAFELTDGRDVDDLNILLVDDTFTTGATIVSAAHPLREAGARVIGVTLGRQLNESWEPSRPVWEEVRSRPFDPERCVLHD